MGIDLSIVEARGIPLDEETVLHLAYVLDVYEEEMEEWEIEEEINRALRDSGFSLRRVRNTWSGETNEPYLALNRVTESHDSRSMEAGFYALSGKPFRLTVAEQGVLTRLLSGTDYEGDEMQSFVAFSIT